VYTPKNPLRHLFQHERREASSNSWLAVRLPTECFSCSS
jgi:hypothetical protein